MRRVALTLALLAALPGSTARAQVAEAWRRVSLSPPDVFAADGPSTAVYPAQDVRVVFSHAQHRKADIDCTQCHDAVEKSKSASDLNIPGHEQCESCHDIPAARRGEATDPKSSCETCHLGVRTERDPYVPDVFPANNLKFPHAVHVAKGVACAKCHAGIDDAELGTRDHLMKMTGCLACHDGEKAPNRCATCHLSEPDGVLITRFASGSLAPTGKLRDDDHGRDFLRRHAQLATSDLESCSSCHRAVECETCHAASSKAFRVHPPDWMASHGISSRSQAMDCAACHREQSFCVACHQQTGAASESRLRVPGSPLGATRFHPDGWSSLVRGNPNHHSFQAQQNIESCASCHQESTCIKCHATTGAVAQVNPHPVGWKESGAACRSLRQAPLACAKCHGGGAGLGAVGQLLVGCP